MFRKHTPIESYVVNDRLIYVKRDDLFGFSPAPPLGKLRGLIHFIDNIYKQGIKTVGCFDTRVSKLGQGVAALCKEYKGMRAVVSFPKKKGGKTPDSIMKAKELGAEIYPLRGNHVSICFAQTKKYLHNKGGVIVPFGLDCNEAVDAIRLEAGKVPLKCIEGGTLVLCSGSGVTLAGLIRGLPILPNRIFAISSGRSIRRILTCVGKHVRKIPSCLEIIPAQLPYYDRPNIQCPFPSHPNYDLKAWKYLLENIDDFQDPIMFWNIGA